MWSRGIKHSSKHSGKYFLKLAFLMLGVIMLRYKRKAIPVNPGKSENQASVLWSGNFALCYSLKECFWAFIRS